MKKLKVSLIVCAFMLVPVLAMAQTAKPADKPKTEANCKKTEAEKKACCAAPEKKAGSAKDVKAVVKK
jgi:hypothetical protein